MAPPKPSVPKSARKLSGHYLELAKARLQAHYDSRRL